MAEAKTIKLKNPIKVGTKSIDEVVLNAPVFEDFMELGEPEYYVPVGDNAGGFVETNMKVVGQYVERLVGKNTDIALLGTASLVDAMAIRDAVLSFFRESRRQNQPPSTSGSDAQGASDSGGESQPQA